MHTISCSLEPVPLSLRVRRQISSFAVKHGNENFLLLTVYERTVVQPHPDAVYDYDEEFGSLKVDKSCPCLFQDTKFPLQK